MRFWVIVLLGLCAAAAQPANQSASDMDAQRLARGASLRELLLISLEEAYQHDGDWPRTIAPTSPEAADLVYIRPEKEVAGAQIGRFGTFGDAYPHAPHAAFDPDEGPAAPVISDKDGLGRDRHS